MAHAPTRVSRLQRQPRAHSLRKLFPRNKSVLIMRQTSFWDFPAGAHVAFFFESSAELIEVLVPFFRAGLLANERCVCSVRGAQEASEMRRALGVIEGLDGYLASRQLEIIPVSQLYEPLLSADLSGQLRSWAEMLWTSRDLGFDGLRCCSSLAIDDEASWRSFMEFELVVNRLFAEADLRAVCAYRLGGRDSRRVAEVICAHPLVLTREGSNYRLLENAAGWSVSRGLEVLYRQSATGVLVVDGPRVLFANAAAAARVGVELRQLQTAECDLLAGSLDANEWALLSRRLRETAEGRGGDGTFEMAISPPGGRTVWAEITLTRLARLGRPTVQLTCTDVTERRRVQREMDTTIQALRLLNETQGLHELLPRVLDLLRGHAGCEIGGIRLQQGQDYPFAVTHGLSHQFLESESWLARRAPDGCLLVGRESDLVLACLCGHLLQRRGDLTSLQLTAGGSFWTNQFQALCRETEAEPASGTSSSGRGRCRTEGFESMALIPLRAGGETFGLVQLCDLRPNRFDLSTIGLLEQLAASLAVALFSAKSAEAQRSSEAMLRALVEHLSDGITLVDESGTITVWNPAQERITGISGKEALGTFIWDLHRRLALGDEHRACQAVEREVRRLLTTPDAPLPNRLLEREIQRPDGTRAFIQTTTFRIPGCEGVALGSSTRDITEQKQAECALVRSRERLRRLSLRLQEVREEERTRLAREVHDELGQALTVLKIDLHWIQRHAEAAAVAARAAAAAGLVDRVTGTARRIASTLRPGVLDHLGLADAIEWQAREFETRTGIQCSLELPEAAVVIPDDYATAVFRAFQEALTNVARHAAASRVTIRLLKGESDLALTVEDDGRGIRDEEIEAPDSLGLLGMRERILHRGGTLDVGAATGGGTRVEFRVPLVVARAGHDQSTSD